MKTVRVAAAAINQTPLDWDQTQQQLREVIAEAKLRGVGVLCLPELCLTGYGCEDAFHSAGTQEMALHLLKDLLPDCTGLAVSFGLPLLIEGALFNVAAMAVDGKLVGFVPKQHLAGDGLHYEQRWFKPWVTELVGEMQWEDELVPVGDLVFEVDGVRIGFEICEDAWVADRPGVRLADRGVDIILNPSASHFAFNKQERRRKLVEEASRAFGVTYVYSNHLGNEAGRVVYDGAAMVASGGDLLVEGPRFSFKPWVLTDCVVDVNQTRLMRQRIVSREPQLQEVKGIIEVDFAFKPSQWEEVGYALPSWEKAEDLKEEEFTRAVALGLYDYMRKSHAKGFAVSLSGGADSTAVVALIKVMLDFVLDELGVDEMGKTLGVAFDETIERKDLMSLLLTTAYQSTRNSSDVTRHAALTVASAIGAKHLDLDVDTLVQGYVGMIEQALGRQLDWSTDDITLQNIQARVRAPGVWMLANLEGKLLLSTSNRSEAAVGYATMDGDTCGGISPIAGIDKAFLLSWLKWMETKGPEGQQPMDCLQVVNVLNPTAELRPEEAHQTDEDDLMPYVVLDAIEYEAIGLKRAPQEVLTVMRARFPQFDEQLMKMWVKRFFILWSRNQWKRERYAPSFHLDDINLDPKTWCRFPILSGSFERELRELD